MSSMAIMKLLKYQQTTKLYSLIILQHYTSHNSYYNFNTMHLYYMEYQRTLSNESQMNKKNERPTLKLQRRKSRTYTSIAPCEPKAQDKKNRRPSLFNQKKIKVVNKSSEQSNIESTYQGVVGSNHINQRLRRINVMSQGVHATCYKQIFPISNKTYGVIYENYYGILENNSDYLHIHRDTFPNSTLLFANIHEHSNVIYMQSINLVKSLQKQQKINSSEQSLNANPQSFLHVNLIEYCLNDKRIINRVNFKLSFAIQSNTSCKVSLIAYENNTESNHKNEELLQKKHEPDYEYRKSNVMIIIEQKNKPYNGVKPIVNILYVNLEQNFAIHAQNSKQKYRHFEFYSFSHQIVILNENQTLLSGSNLKIKNHKIFMLTNYTIYEINFINRSKRLKFKDRISDPKVNVGCTNLEIMTKIKQYNNKSQNDGENNLMNIMDLIVSKEKVQESFCDTEEEDNSLLAMDLITRNLQLLKTNVEIKACCWMGTDRIFLLTHRNLIYEIEKEKIVNCEDLVKLASIGLKDQFQAEVMTVNEIQIIDGELNNTAILVARVESTSTKIKSTKLLTFKISRRWIEFHSIIDQLQQNLQACGTRGIEQKKVNLNSQSIKFIEVSPMSIFYQWGRVNEKLKGERDQTQKKGKKVENRMQLFIAEISVFGKTYEQSLLANWYLGLLDDNKNSSVKNVFKMNYIPQKSDNTETKTFISCSSNASTIAILSQFEKGLFTFFRINTKSNQKIGSFYLGLNNRIFIDNFTHVFQQCWPPKDFCIDSYALNIVIAQRERIQQFYVLSNGIEKGPELLLQDIKFLEYDRFNWHLYAHNGKKIFIIDPWKFQIKKEIVIEGEILDMDLGDHNVMIKWKDRNLNTVSLIVFSLLSSMRQTFIAYETYIFDDLIDCCYNSNENKLILMSKNVLQIHELIFTPNNNPSIQVTCSYSYPISSSSSIAERSINRFASTRKLSERKRSFLRKSSIKIEKRERVKVILEEGEYPSCIKIHQQNIYVGTNFGRLQIYSFQVFNNLHNLSTEFSQLISQSCILKILFSSSVSLVMHVVTQSQMIMSFRIYKNNMPMTEQFEQEQTMRYNRFKNQNQLYQTITADYRLIAQEFKSQYYHEIEELQIMLLRLKGDKQELAHKIKKAFDSDIVELQKLIHKSKIKSKLQEKKIEINAKNDLIKLETFFQGEKDYVNKEMRQDIENKYREEIKVQYENYSQILKENEELKQRLEMNKKSLKEEQQKEMNAMVGALSRNMQQIQMKISDISCQIEVEKEIYYLDVEEEEEEMKELKNKFSQQLQIELREQKQRQQEIQNISRELNKNIFTVRSKINEVEQMCIQFRREINQLTAQKGRKSENFKVVQKYYDQSEDSIKKSILSIKDNKFLKNCYKRRLQIQGLNIELNEKQTQLNFLQNDLNEMYKKVNNMSEQLSSEQQIKTSNFCYMREKEQYLQELKSRNTTVLQKKWKSQNRIVVAKTLIMKMIKEFLIDQIDRKSTGRQLDELSDTNLSNYGERKQEEEEILEFMNMLNLLKQKKILLKIMRDLEKREYSLINSTEASRIMQQNKELVDEINKLRKLSSELKMSEKQLLSELSKLGRDKCEKMHRSITKKKSASVGALLNGPKKLSRIEQLMQKKSKSVSGLKENEKEKENYNGKEKILQDKTALYKNKDKNNKNRRQLRL